MEENILNRNSLPLPDEVGGLLPITIQKNTLSGGKKLLISLPNVSDKRVTVLLTIEGVNTTAALYIIHAILALNKAFYSVEKLNSDTVINYGAKFYVDKSSGFKLYAEREGCLFNITVLQGNINYIPLSNVSSIPSSAELISII